MFFRSKPHNAIALVIILLACRRKGLPITLRKITKKSKLKPKIVNKCLVILKKILPKGQQNEAQPISFLQDYCKKLGFSKATYQLSVYMLKKIKKIQLGQRPATIASCISFMALEISKQNISLDDISKVSEVAKQTIRNLYQDLYSRRFMLFPAGNLTLDHMVTNMRNPYSI